MEVASSILWFVVAIGVLVTVHEFGHFWVARRLGVKVLRFSVGFGRPLVSWRRTPDDVEYCIGAIPLGGYVKMLDEAEGAVAERDLPLAFNRQPLWVRFSVVLAGPAFNFLFALLAYWAVFVIGVDGMRPIVDEVQAGSPAAQAGLGSGSEIVRVGDRDVQTWQGVIETVIGASLDGGRLPLEVQASTGRRIQTEVDMRGVVLDDLSQGQFFDWLGVKPFRPKVAPQIVGLTEGSPAKLAGLEVGDVVVAVDDAKLADGSEFVAYIRERPEVPIRLTVRRDGSRRLLTVTPRPVEGEGRRHGQIGAHIGVPEGSLDSYYATEKYPPMVALHKAALKTWDMSTLTLKLLWKMVMLEVSVKNLSGPISIAQYAGITAQIGFTRFLDFLAIVSISLGLLNLLPIPLLDGGHLMYYCIELVTGRPVSEGVQFIGQRLGIAMLVGLMGLAFYNDLARIFS